MKKRIISLILTLAMVSGLFVTLGTTVTANGVNHNANSNDLCNMLTYAYNAMQFSSPKYYITHHNINNVYNAASLKKNFEDSPTTAIVNSLKDSSGWEQFSTLALLLLKTAFDFDGELTQQDLYDTLLISMLLEGAVEEANDITALSKAQSFLSDIFSLDVTISDKAAPVAVPLFNYLKTSVNRTAFWNSLKEALKKASIDETNDVLTFTANGDTISIHSGLILDFITWATNKKISADTITEITKTLDKLFKILDYGFTTLGELDEFYTNITKAFMIWKCVDEGALVLLEQMRTHTDDNLLKNAINKYIQLINSGSIIGFIECVMQNFVELEVELSCNLLAKIFKNEVLSKFPIYAAGSLVFTVFNLAGNLSQKAEMIYIVHCLNTVNETVIQSIQDIEKICVDGWKSISSVPYCDGYVSGMLMAYRLLSTELDYATEYLTTWYGTDKFNAYFGNNEAWDQWEASIAHIRNLYDTVKPKNFMDNALERYSGHLDVIIKGLTVIYDLNGGEGNIPSQVKPFDGSIYLSDTIPTRRGYTFLGWSVKGELYQSGEELGLYLKDHNTTLRPCWCSDELVITAQWEEAPLPTVPSTFADAKAMVDFSSAAIGVTKGRIRYMTQLTGDKECYVKDYWEYTINGTTGILSSGNKCTRCALSMALSYLGLDYTPGYMSTLYGNTDIPSPLVDVPKLIPSITKVDGTFDTLFNNYASDSGFSPVVVYFNYKHPDDGEIHQHAVLINGKNGDTYYAVDSAANVTKLVELTFNAERTAITSSSYARYADTSSIQGFSQWKLSGTPDPGPVDPEPTSYTLSGIIRNATEGSADYGKVVEGVTVTRKAADGTVIDSTTTDANGTFSFTFTGEKGDYIFMFSKTGFQTKDTAVITIYQNSPSLGAFVIYEEEGYDFSISNPSNGETYPLEQMKATWTTVSDADHYTYSLRDLDTNTAIFENVSTNKKYAYIDASDFEAGHTYRFAVMAKDSYENTLVWAKVEFSIEKTVTTYEISITTPVDGEVYPLDRLKARWTDVEDCDYFTYSLRDTTTNTLIIENQRVGRLYAYIEAENFEAGHTYKFAVMAREFSGDVLAWSQSEFSISDSIPVTGVELDVSSYSLKVRQTYRLKVTVLPTTASNQDVTFKSSNTSIATVNTSGKVTAKSAGTVNITVTTDDGGYKAKCVFTITEENRPVTGISLDITSYSLEVGDTFSLTETILPENATNQKVIWSSSNPSVAVVSSIGNVTAMSVGTTTITATTEDGGYTADCIVTVTNKTPIHGDVNGDGRIDYYDVTALYAAYVSDSFDLDTMDINKDGIVDYYDIARLYAYYRGYIFDL